LPEFPNYFLAGAAEGEGAVEPLALGDGDVEPSLVGGVGDFIGVFVSVAVGDFVSVGVGGFSSAQAPKTAAKPKPKSTLSNFLFINTPSH
jgi:hypothetical protein